MFNFDLLNFAFNFAAQACSPDLCPGSAFDPITASFMTQGYYRQADLLYFFNLEDKGLGGIAALVYTISAFGGIISMVLGAPPRNYVWFFMGPAIYHWLVATTLPTYGARVITGQQDQVWRLNGPLRGENYVLEPASKSPIMISLQRLQK